MSTSQAGTTHTRAHAVITGKVQGVFFRVACRNEASARHLRGWIRNNLDGSVEAVFEGPEAGVKALVEWCRRGPPAAAVENVEVTWGPPQGEHAFRISG